MTPSLLDCAPRKIRTTGRGEGWDVVVQTHLESNGESLEIHF